jgi:hypothetical protein
MAWVSVLAGVVSEAAEPPMAAAEAVATMTATLVRMLTILNKKKSAFRLDVGFIVLNEMR